MRPLIIIYFAFILFVGCNHNTDKINISNYKELSNSVIDSLRKLSNDFYSNNLSPIEYDNFIKEAIAVANNSDNNKALFELYSLVADRYKKAGKFGESIEVLQNAKDIANLLDSDLLRAEATHEIAVNLRKINDNAKALKLHVQVLELAENIEDTFLIHCAYNGIGNVYFSYKDYPRAIEYFHLSLKFLGKENPNLLGEAINSNLLGESWLYLGNTDSALYYMNKSFEANVKIDSDLGKAICHDGMGLVYQKTKDFEKAVSEHKKALQIYEKLQVSFYRTMCLNNLGAAYIGMKEYKLAETLLINAINIADEIGSKQFALDASTNLAELYNKMGKANLSYKYSLNAFAYKDSITDELQKQNTEAMNVLYKAEKQEREILILKQDAELTDLKLSRERFIFIILIGIGITVFVMFFFAFRQRRLRTKIKEIGLEQKLLRAQLNPHFVFNSLSAVQNFILKNNKKEASEYLVNFSRLMRNILMGSGSDFILLENELEILEDYLKLQRLRFQGRFDYSFEISDNINKQECNVPPMLVQPFVENAIEHGVRDIDRQGNIVVRFMKSDTALNIEVEDNGKGLNDSGDNKNKESHISMATKITRQRMQNLQAITKKECKFEVFDNLTKRGLPGVLVVIEIPIQEDA